MAIVNFVFFAKIAIKTSIFNQNQQNKNISCLEFNSKSNGETHFENGYSIKLWLLKAD